MFCSKVCSDTAGKGRHPEQFRMRVIELRTQRKSISEIAQTVHMSEYSVKALIKRMRIKECAPRGRPISSGKGKTALAKRKPENLPQAMRHIMHERLAMGTEPLPPMHPISWGAIAL